MTPKGSWGPALLAALLLLAGLALAPGLGGPFLFDDYPNLTGLAAVRTDPSLYSIWQYVLNGAVGGLGRPVAMLSFALQAGSWSEHPDHFILIGILLHLVNGLLWYALVRSLQRVGAVAPHPALPLLACALWLVLPVHASAVLYVVQRMTVLATGFVLLGLWLYLRGRECAGSRRGRAFVLMTAGAGVATGLGTLSKEIAAVAPMLILALEATLLRAVPRPAGWKPWALAFLALPALLVAGYLAWQTPLFLQSYGARDFTLAERLMTESRLLFAYLAKAWFPSTSARMLYDDLQISRSLLQPWTTALSLAAGLALIALAWHFRRRQPLLAFAVAWYLLANLIESTIIPLELAFDHRSYLPVVGVSLALAAMLLRFAETLRGRPSGRVLYAGVGAYVALLLGCLWLSATLWGHPLAQAHEWVVRQPESRRAVHYYGRLLTNARKFDEAAALYREAAGRWPDDVVIALSLLELGCFHPSLAPPSADLARIIGDYHGGDAARAVGLMHGLVERRIGGNCPGLRADDILRVLDTMRASPRLEHMQVPLLYSTALLLDAEGRKPEALERIERAAAIQPRVPLLQQAVLWSLQLGQTARAREHLRTLESDHIAPRQRWSYRLEIRGTRQLVELYESVPAQ